MSTFITKLTPPTNATGPRVAIKDLLDWKDTPTTAGCKAVADDARPATSDAACLKHIREQADNDQLRIVGKTNLHELAFGATGVNPWFGTPPNPRDTRTIPGGSSSGSAAAVGNDDADVALGSDTGGSVRIPSACCGTTGLKTTWGRISLEGVWPLSTSLDTIGPMARDVAGVVLGMQLLEPGFAVDPITPTRIGRVRNIQGVDPRIDEAIDDALRAAEFEVVDVELPGWHDAEQAGVSLMFTEALSQDGNLDRQRIGDDVNAFLDMARQFDAIEATRAARRTQGAWQAELAATFTNHEVDLLALPTLRTFPPDVDHAADVLGAILTMAINVAGVPALAMPVTTTDRSQPVPPSLQLVGPANSEERLLAAGRRVEAAT
jgi:amidase